MVKAIVVFNKSNKPDKFIVDDYDEITIVCHDLKASNFEEMIYHIIMFYRVVYNHKTKFNLVTTMTYVSSLYKYFDTVTIKISNREELMRFYVFNKQITNIHSIVKFHVIALENLDLPRYSDIDLSKWVIEIVESMPSIPEKDKNTKIINL